MLKVAIFTDAARTAILQGVAVDRQSNSVTLDGRYFVVVCGRLRRMSDPSLWAATRLRREPPWTTQNARSARADRRGGATAPDYIRHMAANTPDATWLATLKPSALDDGDGGPD